jgi:hypothetical protein
MLRREQRVLPNRELWPSSPSARLERREAMTHPRSRWARLEKVLSRHDQGTSWERGEGPASGQNLYTKLEARSSVRLKDLKGVDEIIWADVEKPSAATTRPSGARRWRRRNRNPPISPPDSNLSRPNLSGDKGPTITLGCLQKVAWSIASSS